VQHYNCRKISIAAPIKAMVHAAFAAAGVATDSKGFLRAPLQQAGLAGRQFDPDLWVRSLIDRYDLEDEHQATGYVVTDIRYVNEAELLRQYGFTLLRIEAPVELRKARSLARGDGSWNDGDSLHPSEVEQRSITADELLTNDTTDPNDLYAQLESLIQRYALPDTATF